MQVLKMLWAKSFPWNRLAFGIIIAFILLYFIFYYLRNSQKIESSLNLEFIPDHKIHFCEDLFVNTPADGFSMSPSYRKKVDSFKRAVNNSIQKNGEKKQGFTETLPVQHLALHYLASQPFVKTVCETGFNFGHSSFNYLTASDQTTVHSFDLGAHNYSHVMAKYMKGAFPSRFFIHFGDSVKTIPKFSRKNPKFLCDMIFIDGGHVFPVALADLRNFAKMSRLERNIIMLDDYPTKWGQSIGQAWDDAVKEGIVQELMRCTIKQPLNERGFILGKFIRKS